MSGFRPQRHSAQHVPPKQKRQILFLVPGLLALALAIPALLWIAFFDSSSNPAQPAPPPTFFASIDTMKMSRDTIHHPLSAPEIAKIVQLTASMHVNYITVDTYWDYPAYMQLWVNAIRATGRHVWFRIHPDQWEDDNGTTGLMTPASYKHSEEQFILTHASFFQANDIFDPCPEPEQGLYWAATYGSQWTYNAPNQATHAYNAFLRDTTDIADHAFRQVGISGVITTIRSTNSFFPSQRGVFEAATVQKFGRITVDSYPERDMTDPAAIANARIAELNTIKDLWHLPIIIGEMGYSNAMPVDDQTQHAVLKSEFATLLPLSYVHGVNYWVGPGSSGAGGYTYIFVYSHNMWRARPAAQDVSSFFAARSG